MNKIILSLLFAGFGAQAIKLIWLWFKHKTLSWRDLVVTGGMPSSHSAFVISLASSVYLEEGLNTSFAISLVLAMIVLRDAFGVRRTAGEEGSVINLIIKRLKMKTETHFAMGHTPLQVLVGALIGLIVSLGVYYFL
ncbi:MAG TPA: divergent PAP2 family protein [Candidatus Nanoarchaeia archaeon]|nr:divergent PAP2 family protein [Candidatus Nanoarchaeia archaeon]